MNDPTFMYNIRPVIKLSEEIELPECMYKMKNILQSHFSPRVDHLNKGAKATSISEQSPLPEVSALESRQEAILEQLNQLKKQMSALRAELKQTVPTCTTSLPVTKSNGYSPVKNDLPQNIVINANPRHPPYSLLAFCRLWSSSVRLSIHCHMHSTVVELPENLKIFLPSRCLIEPNDDFPRIDVALIWKNVADTELLVSPTKHIAIRGEVNILRYLSRLGPSEYNYELCSDPSLSCQMDALLDICYSLNRDPTVKIRQYLIRSLNAHLKNSPYLAGGDNISLADVAAWSTIKQLGTSASKDVTVGMRKWLQLCEEELMPEP